MFYILHVYETIKVCLQYSCCYGRFVGHVTRNVYGYGSGRIWLDDMQCSGSESSLGECRNRGWGVHNCAHREDVAISCPLPTTSTISPSRTYHSYSYQVLPLCLKPCVCVTNIRLSVCTEAICTKFSG